MTKLQRSKTKRSLLEMSDLKNTRMNPSFSYLRYMRKMVDKPDPCGAYDNNKIIGYFGLAKNNDEPQQPLSKLLQDASFVKMLRDKYFFTNRSLASLRELAEDPDEDNYDELRIEILLDEEFKEETFVYTVLHTLTDTVFHEEIISPDKVDKIFNDFPYATGSVWKQF